MIAITLAIWAVMHLLEITHKVAIRKEHSKVYGDANKLNIVRNIFAT